MNKPRRALVSVSDKTGLEELAKGLDELDFEIVSTSSTAGRIRDAGLPVTEVSDVTGFPEIMDGRVKTLHPLIHGGILARPQDLATMVEHGIEPFELVIVNLYPFSQTVASGANFEDCIEKIDIGGPAMVRSSAKNHQHVGVVTDPADYQRVLQELRDEGGLMVQTRFQLAYKAFKHTAAYDAAIAEWFGRMDGEEFPDTLTLSYDRPTVLRYGENPHQPARLYHQGGATGGLANAQQLHGKEMSHNNYVDTTAAWRAAHDFEDPCVAVIKHTNPCGIAVGDDVAEAHRKAHACDPVSAFGGVIATNQPVSVAMAEQVAKIFTEVIAAPSYEEGALAVLAKREDLRVLQVELLGGASTEFRQVPGGLLVQNIDFVDEDGDYPENWTLQCGDPADAAMLADLAFAWRACRSVKSNAILLVAGGASVGVGMGQVNRVDSAKIAVERAGDRALGSVAASDAFFPFADGLQVLIDAGVKAVVEPGGSKKDEQVIAAAQAAGITLYFTGVRHFAH